MKAEVSHPLCLSGSDRQDDQILKDGACPTCTQKRALPDRLYTMV